MMNCRLVALDLDNTIVGPQNGPIHPIDVAAIKKCAAEGIQMVLASARPPRAMKPYWDQLGLQTLGIAYNGGLVWDFNKGYAYKGWYFSKTDVLLILDIIDRMEGALFWLEAQNQLVTEVVQGEALQVSINRGGSPTIVTSIRDWLDKPINKLILFGNRQLPLTAQIKEHGFSVTIHEHPSMTEVRPPGINKGRALIWLCHHLGVLPEETVCIGDSSDDIPMYMVSGLSIAVGNATDATLQAADIVAPSISMQGVATALEQLLHWKKKIYGIGYIPMEMRNSR